MAQLEGVADQLLRCVDGDGQGGGELFGSELGDLGCAVPGQGPVAFPTQFTTQATTQVATDHTVADPQGGVAVSGADTPVGDGVQVGEVCGQHQQVRLAAVGAAAGFDGSVQDAVTVEGVDARTVDHE